MYRPLFYCHYWLRFWPILILAPFKQLVLRGMAQKMADDIQIVDASQRQMIDQRYLEDTVAALGLIKTVDQRRYRRVRREIKRIINTESLRFAFYQRPGRVCQIDYGRITSCVGYPNHREWYLWWYAATLVHEATHGAIHSRGVLYTKISRVRIQHLCHTEQKRFARKADTAERQWSEGLVGLFDERNWHSWWFMTTCEAVKQLVTRLREAQRSVAQDTADQNKK